MSDIKPGLANVWNSELTLVHQVIAKNMIWWNNRGDAPVDEQTKQYTVRDQQDKANDRDTGGKWPSKTDLSMAA